MLVSNSIKKIFADDFLVNTKPKPEFNFTDINLIGISRIGEWAATLGDELWELAETMTKAKDIKQVDVDCTIN